MSETQTKNLLDRLADWWRAVRDAGRLGMVDAAELDHMAHEFGLRGDELVRLSRTGAHAADQLQRMMRAAGLSYEQLRQAHPDVARDLEIHCSLCLEKKRCRRELDSGAAQKGFKEYCPNAPTLVELQAGRLQRLV